MMEEEVGHVMSAYTIGCNENWNRPDETTERTIRRNETNRNEILKLNKFN